MAEFLTFCFPVRLQNQHFIACFLTYVLSSLIENLLNLFSFLLSPFLFSGTNRGSIIQQVSICYYSQYWQIRNP